MDLTDETAMGVLRARLLGGAMLLGGVLSLLSPATTPELRADSALSVNTALLLGVSTALLLRARRMGSWEFWGWLLATQTLIALSQGAVQRTMPQVPLESAMIFQLIMAAAFCSTRLQALTQALVAMLGAMFIIWTRVGFGVAFSSTATIEITIDLCVAVAVRVLRDVAHQSLLHAQRGELTDPLTGLANRRALERQGGARWSDEARAGKPITFLLLDIDHFKKVNDTQGHAAGDELIRRVADLITSTLRQGDLAVRLGGEEFLLMTRATVAEGQIIAERLRRRFEQELAPVTVSIGVTEACPEPGDSVPVQMWRAIDTADQALYQAKNSGRNRVVVNLLPEDRAPAPA